MPEAVIVPGLLAIDPQLWSGSGSAQVLRHPLAGYAELVDFADWKSSYTFVLREAAQRSGIEAPADVLNLGPLPLVAAQVARSTLVLVAEHEGERLAKAGELVVTVSYHRGAGGGGVWVRHNGTEQSMDLEDYELAEHASGRGELDEDDDDFDDDFDEDDVAMPPLYDRILRAMTNEQVSLLHVDLALWCSTLPEQDLESLERELAEIDARGNTQRAQAEAIIMALDGAAEDEVELLQLGRATRESQPAFTLSEELSDYRGEPISVPAADAWHVDAVAAYMPAERSARIERFREERKAQRTEAVEKEAQDRTLMFAGLGIAAVLLLGAVALGLR